MIHLDSTPSSAPLGQLLLLAFRWFDERLLAALAREGWPHLSPSQSLVFAYLNKHGLRTSELARNIGVSRQAVHRTITELIALELVELTTDPNNKSAKLVKPTARGKASIRTALRIFEELEDSLENRIGQENVAALRRVLEIDWGSS